MYKNLVSCILPTYNRPSFLARSLLCLENQTNKNFEVIIVNDGGTPISLDTKISNITVVDLEQNSGSVTIPRNIGISRAKGEFIAHIDDDVMSLALKLELLTTAIGSNILAYGNRVESRNGYSQFSYPPVIKKWNPSLPDGWGVDGGQFIYRAEFYNQNPYVFARRACDWELAKRLWKYKPFSFVHVDSNVCIYEWHNTNRSNDETTKIKKIYPSKFKEYFVSSRWNHAIPDEC
jgi:glycosyltransferase involved in cell wall biosynthesis